MSSSEATFLAHVAELEELGWAEVAARMDLWRMCGYDGDWQNPKYDPPQHWSWPDFDAREDAP